MSIHSNPGRLLVIMAIAFLCVLTAGAQSGRKVRKTTPAPPVPMPAPESTPKPAEEKKPSLTLVVGMQRTNLFDNARIYNAGGALLTFVDRLDDHPGVKVAHVRGDMSRGEAVRRAKSEKEAYVVLLELSLDRMAGTADGQLRLFYWVFSPVTAKLKASGQVYPHTNRNRGVIMSPRTPGIYDDYQVQEAAREAAARVLKSFQLQFDNRRSF